MQVQRTQEFVEWLVRPRDMDGRRRIEQRLDRIVQTGNLGYTRHVGNDVSELRLHFGSSYRLYYTQQGETIIFLLLGGDKGSQSRDILKAQELASLLE